MLARFQSRPRHALPTPDLAARVGLVRMSERVALRLPATQRRFAASEARPASNRISLHLGIRAGTTYTNQTEKNGATNAFFHQLRRHSLSPALPRLRMHDRPQ